MLHGDLYSRFLLGDGEVDLRVTVMFLTTLPFFSFSTFLNSGSSFFQFDSFISIVVYSRGIFYWLGKSRSHISLYLRSSSSLQQPFSFSLFSFILSIFISLFFLILYRLYWLYFYRQFKTTNTFNICTAFLLVDC